MALTRVLVSTPSVNPELEAGGAGEGAAAELCSEWLRSWGFKVEVSEPTPGRPTILARVGEGPPSLLLNGHLDTVGVAGMAHPPFEATLSEGRIHGRGACDMKGGVAAILAAARALAANPPPSGQLQVALTCDEEHGSLGMKGLLDDGLEADGAVVCEPTGLSVAPANKGFVWLHVNFRGRAAHGSRPDLGVDAIQHAGHFLAALEGLQDDLFRRRGHPLLGHGSLHAGTIEGGTAPSVYPEECRLVLERRTLPGEDPDGAAQEVRGVLDRAGDGRPGWDPELERGLTRPAAEINTETPLVGRLLREIEARSVEPRVTGMTAWVESSLLTEAGVPAVCFGPGSLELAHAARESVPVRELESATEILEGFARAFLAGEDPEPPVSGPGAGRGPKSRGREREGP